LQWQNKDPLPGGTTTNSTIPSQDMVTMHAYQTDRHVVVTWKESTGQAIAYENGMQAATITIPNSMSSLDDVNVWLGRSMHTDSGAAAEYEEVRFYNYVLTLPQVIGNFQVGPDTVNTSTQAATVLSSRINGLAMAQTSAARPRTPTHSRHHHWRTTVIPTRAKFRTLSVA
jgi:hypothetical protein